MDTIFAEATAPGKAGVAIIRISGPDAFGAGRALVRSLPDANRAVLRTLRDGSGRILDRGLVLIFDKGSSFTGEAVVELQLHGSRAVVAAVLSTLEKLPGLRPAAAGEFTRRALENDRLDLTQVEGLADLIDAETELQRLQAQRVLSGEMSYKVLKWREKIIHASALVEATLDFADEEVPVDVSPDVLALISDVTKSLQHEADGFGVSERIRDGFEVAILGPPNAGKSTLLNALARRDVALTSDIAGTTRDVLEVRADLAGLPVTFLDTAGLRDTFDPLESAGIARARDRAHKADLRVFLADAAGQEFQEWKSGDILILGKSDLRVGDVSGLTGDGLDNLIVRITEVLKDRALQPSIAIRERHLVAISSALSFLQESSECIKHGIHDEMAAESLRQAARALEGLIGRVDVDDLLGDIFSRFCIGK